MQPVPSTSLLTYLQRLDDSLGEMMQVLNEEADSMSRMINQYSKRCARLIEQGGDHTLLTETYQQLQQAAIAADQVRQLPTRLKKLQDINRMVRVAIHADDQNSFFRIPGYVDTIAHACLAQLKSIRIHHKKITETIRQIVMQIWLNRSLAEKLALLLTTGSTQHKKLGKLFRLSEVLYADISLEVTHTSGDDLHRHIILRMIANRLSKEEGKEILTTLFPEWSNLNLCYS